MSQSPLPDNTHNNHKRQTSFPLVGFEPAIPATYRPQTHALDRAATAIGNKISLLLPTYLLTCLLTYSMEQSPSWQATQFSASQEIPPFYRTRSFITAFISVRHLSLSWASSIQSVSPHHTSWRSVLILSSHLCLGIPNGLFPSGFPTKTLYMPLPFAIHASWPIQLILLDFITATILGTYH